MQEYILTIKDVEGNTQDLKTFADGIAGVIHNMVALETVEAIGLITRTKDNYTWDVGFKSLSKLKRNLKKMKEFNLYNEYRELIKELDDKFSCKQ